MVIGGLLGAVQAIVILAWPEQVSPDRYSYPFETGWYAVAQLSFAVQHLLLLPGLLAGAALARAAASRVGWYGGLAAALGMLGLAACEGFALTAAGSLVGDAAATRVDNTYGVPMVVIGVGLVLLGSVLGRRRLLAGRTRWTWLLAGLWVFAPMFPAVFGPFTIARLAILGWFLIFAAMGWSLLRPSRTARP